MDRTIILILRKNEIIGPLNLTKLSIEVDHYNPSLLKNCSLSLSRSLMDIFASMTLASKTFWSLYLLLDQKHFGQRYLDQSQRHFCQFYLKSNGLAKDISAKIFYQIFFVAIQFFQKIKEIFFCLHIFFQIVTFLVTSPKYLWLNCHFGQKVSVFKQISLAKMSLSQISWSQKCDGQNVFVPKVKQSKNFKDMQSKYIKFHPW